MTSLPQDLEEALGHVMAQEGLSRDEVLIAVLREGLAARKQAGPLVSPPAQGSDQPDRPDPEVVQYPGYFKGDGSL